MLPTWVVLTLTARRAIGSASMVHESSIPNLKLTLQKNEERALVASYCTHFLDASERARLARAQDFTQ